MTYEHKTTQLGGEEWLTELDLEALKAEETATAERKERSRLEAIWWAGARERLNPLFGFPWLGCV